jgi:predicted TPR repeat methyltransferase
MVEEHLGTCCDLTSSKTAAWKILDMGCGSGLVGRVFSKFVDSDSSNSTSSADSDLSEPVIDLDKLADEKALRVALKASLNSSSFAVGVDVSAAIARVAYRNGGYRSVFVGDLRKILAACSSILNGDVVPKEDSENFAKFDLVAAADTFIYIGTTGFDTNEFLTA